MIFTVAYSKTKNKSNDASFHHFFVHETFNEIIVIHWVKYLKDWISSPNFTISMMIFLIKHAIKGLYSKEQKKYFLVKPQQINFTVPSPTVHTAL